MPRHETIDTMQSTTQQVDPAIAAQNEWLFGKTVEERHPRDPSDHSVMDTYSKIYPISEEEVRSEVLAGSPAERTRERALAHMAAQNALAAAEKPRPLFADEVTVGRHVGAVAIRDPELAGEDDPHNWPSIDWPAIPPDSAMARAQEQTQPFVPFDDQDRHLVSH